MPTTLADLATLVGGRLSGAYSANNSATNNAITGAAILDVAVAGELTLVDHADRVAPMFLRNLIKTRRYLPNRFIPRRGNQLAALFVTDHRRANAGLVIDERMPEAALDAEKLTIDSVDVAIARY